MRILVTNDDGIHSDGLDACAEIGKALSDDVWVVAPEFDQADLERWTMSSDTPMGRLTHLAPVVQFSETPARWARPSVPLGHSDPVWPAR